MKKKLNFWKRVMGEGNLSLPSIKMCSVKACTVKYIGTKYLINIAFSVVQKWVQNEER
jgi:hypothetical protein